MSKEIYLKSFFYFLYLAFLSHYMLSMPILDFFATFSEIGGYFAGILILFFLGYVLLQKKIVLFDYKQHVSTILICALLIAHTLTLLNFNKNFFGFISNYINIHFLFLFFISCITFIFLGIWLLNKIDKRIVFFPIGMMLVYSVYFLVQWHSFNQQKELFLDVYTVAVNANIRNLKECNKKIVCYITKENGDLSELIEQAEGPYIQKEYQQPLKSYLIKFQKKVNSNDNDLVYLSYLDDVYSFNNDFYQPLGVLNKKTHAFIVDYHNSINITNRGYEFYKRITGTSSFFWMLFMHLIILFHFLLRTKKVKIHA